MAQEVSVIVGAEDRARLAAVVGDRNRPLKHVQRARIVLLSADRLPVLEIARQTPEEWLLIEWSEDEEKPTKYWLSTLPETTTLDALAETAKLRWRIERDYRKLKQELGLGHYEGRGWRGFHHHATLCIAAYGFLIGERAAIPPSGPPRSGYLQAPDLPESFRPRGSAIAP